MAAVKIAEFLEHEISMLLDALDTKLRSVNTTQGRTKSPRLVEAFKAEVAAVEALKSKLLSRSVVP